MPKQPAQKHSFRMVLRDKKSSFAIRFDRDRVHEEMDDWVNSAMNACRENGPMTRGPYVGCFVTSIDHDVQFLDRT